jgi:hypothetical protein
MFFARAKGQAIAICLCACNLARVVGTKNCGQFFEDKVEVVRRVPELSRRHCREVFEKRFTAARMAQDYVQRLINNTRDNVLGVRT